MPMRVNLRQFKTSVLLVIVILSGLSIALRGRVPGRTYYSQSFPPNQLEVQRYKYDVECEDGLAGDICLRDKEWEIEGQAELYNDKNTVVFDSRKGSKVRASIELDADPELSPIFFIRYSTPVGVNYTLSLTVLALDESEDQLILKEASIDDYERGSGWDYLFFDLKDMGRQAGYSIVRIASFILDYETIDEPSASLMISEIGFLGSGLKTVGDGEDKDFDSAIIKLPADSLEGIRWMTVNYWLESVDAIPYSIVVKTEDGYLRCPHFVSHDESYLDVTRLDYTTHKPNIPELGLFPGEYNSVILMKNNLYGKGFHNIKVDAVELLFLTQSGRMIEKSEAFTDSFIVLLHGLTFFIPLALLVIYYLEIRGFVHLGLSERNGLPLLIYGTLVRLLLAPLTGHSYDMEVWAQVCRIYYESGSFRYVLGPQSIVLPILIIFYSPYALLRAIGFTDAFFLGKVTGIIESLFIKTPFILADLAVYFILARILRGETSDSRRWFYSMVYFLNPLAIFLSGVWGMFDAVALAFFLTGLMFYLEDKPVASSFSYALSGLTKVYGFMGLLTVFTRLLRWEKWREKIILLLSISGSLALISYLFMNKTREFTWFVVDFLRNRFGMGTETPYIGSHSLLSYLSMQGVSLDARLLNISLVVLVGVLSVYFLIKWIKTGPEPESILLYYILAFTAFYQLFYRVYEHYYLWILPVLIIYAVYRRDGFYILVSIFVSSLAYPSYYLGLFVVDTWKTWFRVNYMVDGFLLFSNISVSLIFLLLYILWGDKLSILDRPLARYSLFFNVQWYAYTVLHYFIYERIILGLVWIPASAILGLFYWRLRIMDLQNV
ncbi:hypothetical protein GF319_00855 [Candidatus Bathyarchaeota archaeon]|nr:hypothetical protein [Candidatus Bathyarchaeota archaeon]